jgi:serine/threonine protein kinase
MLQNMGALMPLGIHAPLKQLLGKGSFGTAYKVNLFGQTSVLKLTRDPSEVQASTLLKGKPSKRIVRIHDLWAIKGTFERDLRGWYAIHREYLTPLSKKDAALVEAIFVVYGDTSLDLTFPRSARQHAMLQKWRGYLRMEMMDGDGMPLDEEGGALSMGNPKLIQRGLQLLIQIGQGVDEMHKAGIDWEDVHSGNIMRNARGALVIADVGFGLMHDDFDAEIPFLTSDVAREYVSEEPVAGAQ